MKRWGLALVIVGLLAFHGCFGGGATIERTYFSLQYPIENAARRYVSPRYRLVVQVKRFDSAIAYDKQEIVYRASPYEFRYYGYKMWAAKPRKMLAEMVLAHLRRSNLFDDVVMQIGQQLPTYVLTGEILAIEELDSTEETWFAHMAMRISLVRFEDRKLVWEYSFDRKKRVHQRKPVFVVRALSAMFEEEMGKVVVALDTRLAKLHDAPAPERVVVKKPTRPSAKAAVKGGEKPPDNGEPQPKATLIR